MYKQRYKKLRLSKFRAMGETQNRMPSNHLLWRPEDAINLRYRLRFWRAAIVLRSPTNISSALAFFYNPYRTAAWQALHGPTSLTCAQPIPPVEASRSTSVPSPFEQLRNMRFMGLGVAGAWLLFVVPGCHFHTHSCTNCRRRCPSLQTTHFFNSCLYIPCRISEPRGLQNLHMTAFPHKVEVKVLLFYRVNISAPKVMKQKN